MRSFLSSAPSVRATPAPKEASQSGLSPAAPATASAGQASWREDLDRASCFGHDFARLAPAPGADVLQPMMGNEDEEEQVTVDPTKHTPEELASFLPDENQKPGKLGPLNGSTREAISKEIGARTVRSVSQLPGAQAIGDLHELLGKHGIGLDELALQQSETSQKALTEYTQSRGPRGEADSKMLQSLLAMSRLHQMGYFNSQIGQQPLKETPEIRRLTKLASLADEDKDKILDTYGLSQEERQAIQHYTNAHTNDLMTKSFGSAQMGWQHLSTALQKLPSTGDLGLSYTTFRVPRKNEGASITAMDQGSLVYHGYKKMDQDQRHFLSTATTYNVHTSPKRLGETGGVMGITGTSGRYINPFGVMSTMTDGAEILYPPRMISRYHGTTSEGPKSIPLHHFTETSGTEEQPPQIHEDMDYGKIRNPWHISRSKPQEERLDLPVGTPYRPQWADIPQRTTIRKRQPRKDGDS